MSKIRRLSLRGIRNFGDDNEDALIRFSCPLTLILGPNGTGKTTIIEALKYTTTGEFPPGSDKGKSFIHDPILATTGSVRGVVKAEIVDAGGNIYTVCRTIESLKAVNRFKTLDTTLTRISKDKENKASITNRCADIDAELSVALGVSKSILNSVIFCHQDELNWPFDQGKALKDRFDEIFDTNKYNKALENIGKIYKRLQGELRSLNAEKQAFSVLVSEVESKETELMERKERLVNCEEKIHDIDKQLESLKCEIEEAQRICSDYKSLQTKEERKKMEYNMHKKQYDDLYKNIEKIYIRTPQEFNDLLLSHDYELNEKKNLISLTETKMEDISKEETKLTNILATQRETVGTLKQQVKDHEKKKVHRNHLVNDESQIWGLDAIASDISEMEVMVLMKRLESKMREKEEKVEKIRLIMQKEEKELQNVVDTLSSNYFKIESEKNIKEKEIKEIKDAVTTVQSQITQIGTAENKLKSIEHKIEAAKQQTDELNNHLDVSSVKADIEKKTKSRDEIEENLNTIDSEISSLHKLTLLTAEFELNKSTLQAKEEEFEKLKEKHEENITALLNIQELQPTKLANILRNVHRRLEEEISNLVQKIQEEEHRAIALETTLRHAESDIANKKMELEQNKQRISAVCGYKDFDETLLLQSKIIKDLQHKRGIYAYQATAYGEYIKTLSAENPCCPLCHRNFQKQDTVKDLIKEMENDIISNQPDRLKTCEEKLKMHQEKYDNMLQLKPIVEQIIRCEEKELKKLTEKLEKIRLNWVQCKERVKTLQASKIEPEKKLKQYKEIIGDVKLWDRCIEDIEHLKDTISEIQSQVFNAGVNTDRTMEEAQVKKEFLKTHLKETRDYIERLQIKLNRHNERLQHTRDVHNKLNEERLKIYSDMQKLRHLKDKLEDLRLREVTIGTTVKMLQEKLSNAKDLLNSGVERLEKAKAENWQKQEMDRKSIAECTRRLSDLHNTIAEINAFTCSNVSEKLANYEQEIEALRNSLKELILKKKNLEEVLSKLNKDIASQEVDKRNLLDNIALQEIKEAVEAVEVQCNQLKEKLKNINFTELENKLRELESKKHAFLRQRNIALGNQEELERGIKQYTKELQKEEYRCARRNYMKKSIELTVHEGTIDDLKIYSEALDIAMIEYHEERMSSINKIMKKLWKHVYKGTDTSSIEIRAEATQGVGSNKRSYNYKLIQTKHGCEMDMKGRCSAGQKMLASIILRLALAETFCKDCGILALDEPTTNLDEENANSLADTLTKIVELRSRHQRSFQLIIISHDEKFLQKLASLNNHKRFHELYRKQNGMTAVKMSDFYESTISSIHIKDEDESDDEEEEEQYPRHLINPSASSTIAEASNRKRYNWNDFNKDI